MTNLNGFLHTFFACLIALLVLGTTSLAQASDVTDTTRINIIDITSFDQHLILNDKLVFMEDTTPASSAVQIANIRQDKVWHKTTDTIPNLGLGVKPHWFAIHLQNNGSNDHQALLDIPYTMIDYLDVYWVQGDRITLAAKVGDLRPFDQRPLAHRHFLIPIQLAAEQDLLILIRAESFGALKLPLELWSLEAFFAYDQKAIAPQLAFAGLMFALALYNLFLLWSTRDWNYLWYVLSVVSISFVVMSFHGILAQYVWPQWPQLNNPVLVGSISVNIIAATLFAYSFLNLSRFKWPVKTLFLTHTLAGAIIFILNLFLPYIHTIKLVALFSVTGATTGIITGCYLWYRGEILARFYTIAWFLLLLGSVTITFSHFGWLPSIVLFDYGQQIGAAAEGLLLSFALAYRINMERRKRFAAQAQLLHLQQQANHDLELRVNERTNELASANEKLLEMSLTDSLTQVKNRKFMDHKLKQEWLKKLSNNHTLSMLMIDGDHFKAINDNYGHLCGDALLQHLATIFKSCVQRDGDVVCRYGGEEFAVILCNTELAGAAQLAESIRNKVEQSSIQWAEESLTLTISIGVACSVAHIDANPSTLISAADEALYAAKNAGRNRVMVNVRRRTSTQSHNHIIPPSELSQQHSHS
jgi:diguanylate cyclase (GGDEF)-like protein